MIRLVVESQELTVDDIVRKFDPVKEIYGVKAMINAVRAISNFAGKDLAGIGNSVDMLVANLLDLERAKNGEGNSGLVIGPDTKFLLGEHLIQDMIMKEGVFFSEFSAFMQAFRICPSIQQFKKDVANWQTLATKKSGNIYFPTDKELNFEPGKAAKIIKCMKASGVKTSMNVVGTYERLIGAAIGCTEFPPKGDISLGDTPIEVKHVSRGRVYSAEIPTRDGHPIGPLVAFIEEDDTHIKYNIYGNQKQVEVDFKFDRNIKARGKVGFTDRRKYNTSHLGQKDEIDPTVKNDIDSPVDTNESYEVIG